MFEIIFYSYIYCILDYYIVNYTYVVSHLHEQCFGIFFSFGSLVLYKIYNLNVLHG